MRKVRSRTFSDGPLNTRVKVSNYSGGITRNPIGPYNGGWLWVSDAGGLAYEPYNTTNPHFDRSDRPSMKKRAMHRPR
jgi:hypothetical protein